MPVRGRQTVLSCGQSFIDLAWSSFERDLIELWDGVGLVERKWKSVKDE